VEQWHGNVKDDDIRSYFGGKCEQGATIGDAPDDFATRFEQLRECLPDQAMVIRQQDTRARHGGLPRRTLVITPIIRPRGRCAKLALSGQHWTYSRAGGLRSVCLLPVAS